MIEPRTIYESYTCRFRCVIVVGLTSLSMIASEWNVAHAGWWSLPIGRKPADDADSKSNVGYSAKIRKLMKEAKAQEELGNLDRAIVLADRAAKMSESTSKVVKSAADVSPAATSRYANELRLKKTELSVTRKEGAPAREKPLAADRSSEEKTSIAKISPRPPKKLLGSKDTKDTLKTPDRKVAGKNPTLPTTFAAVESKSPPSAAATPSKVADASPVVEPPKKSKASVEPRDEFTDEDFAAAADTAKPQKEKPARLVAASIPEDNTVDTEDWNSTPKTSVEADQKVKTTSFDDDEPPQVTPMPSSAPDRRPVANQETGPAPMKLRPLYASTAFEETLAPAGTMSPTEFEGEPTITPMATSSHDDVAPHKPRKILPEPAKITPVVAEEAPKSSWDESLVSEPCDQGVEPKSHEDAVEEQTDDRSQVLIPTDKTDDLKRRLESASLEPGAVAPRYNNSNIAESDTTGRILRLRKRRQPLQRFPAAPLVETASSSARHQVVGQAAMIQWRPAKQESVSPVTASKSARMPDDIRQSVRDISVSTREAQPNSDFNRTSSTMAPFPPPETAIEQTSFDASKDSFGPPRPSRQGQESNWAQDHSPLSESSSSIATLSDLEDTNGTLLSSEPNLPANGQPVSKQDDSSAGPMERIARALGVPTSTLLSATGLAAFLAGLWIVRATVRSRIS